MKACSQAPTTTFVKHGAAEQRGAELAYSVSATDYSEKNEPPKAIE